MTEELSKKIDMLEQSMDEMKQDYSRQIAIKEVRIDALVGLIFQLHERVTKLEKRCNIEPQSIDIHSVLENTDNNAHNNYHNYNNNSNNTISWDIDHDNEYNSHNNRTNRYDSGAKRIDWATLQDMSEETDYSTNDNSYNEINTNNNMFSKNSSSEDGSDVDERVEAAVRDMHGPLFDSTYWDIVQAKRDARNALDCLDTRNTRDRECTGEREEEDAKERSLMANNSDSGNNSNKIAKKGNRLDRELDNYESVVFMEGSDYILDELSGFLLFNKRYVECGYKQLKIDSFDDFGFEDCILRGVYAYGFEIPSKIELRSIMPIMKGKNIIMQGSSGSGKSCAYLIAICNKFTSLLMARNEAKSLKWQKNNKKNNKNNKHNKNKEKNGGCCECIIIVPSRELCLQICKIGRTLCEYIPNNCSIEWIPLYGGTSVRGSMQTIQNCENSVVNWNKTSKYSSVFSNCGIIVGTKGRIEDFIERGVLDISNLKTLIIDDFDCLMCNKKFVSFLNQNILKNVRNKRNNRDNNGSSVLQTVFVTTSLSKESYKNAKQWIAATGASGGGRNINDKNECLEIVVSDKDLLNLKKYQWEVLYYKSNNVDDGYNVFMKNVGVVLSEEMEDLLQCAVFVNSSRMCDMLVAHLKEYFDSLKNNSANKSRKDMRGIYSPIVTVGGLHDDMVQRERELVLKEFRSGSTRILVCTNIMAHGIDIQPLSLIIMQMPNSIETFVNRVGRCGRYGRRGKVVSLIDQTEQRSFERLTNIFNVKPTKRK